MKFDILHCSINNELKLHTFQPLEDVLCSTSYYSAHPWVSREEKFLEKRGNEAALHIPGTKHLLLEVWTDRIKLGEELLLHFKNMTQSKTWKVSVTASRASNIQKPMLSFCLKYRKLLPLWNYGFELMNVAVTLIFRCSNIMLFISLRLVSQQTLEQGCHIDR